MRVIFISAIIVCTALVFLIQAGIAALPEHTVVLQEETPDEYSHDYCPWGDCPHGEMNTGKASEGEERTAAYPCHANCPHISP